MPLTFRRMSTADSPACAQELIAAFREAPWNEFWTTEQALERIDGIMSARVSRGIVCMDGERCVSMLAGRIMTYQEKKLFYIDEFSVHPAWQRQGVGSRVLARLCEALQQEPHPVSHMSLITERGFPSVAFLLREKRLCGAQERPDMAGYVNGPSLHAKRPPAYQIRRAFSYASQMAIHQHTPYLSITVALKAFQGSAPRGCSTTPPSDSTSKVWRTTSSLPISKQLKVIVSHFS